jgi:hypothetical protein
VASRTRPVVETLEDRSLLSSGSSAVAETLYVGDGSDDTVKMFDAATGTYEGALVSPGSGGLHGPRGLIFRNDGQLLAVDQNVFEPNPGEILRYNGITGNFLGNLVFQTDPNAPFAPRGMVLGANHTVYVGDDGNLDGIIIGRVARFNSETGAFLGDLQPTGFTGDFYPRGVVIGPDGLVYATVRNIAPTGGEIMRWDPVTGNFLGSFVTSDATNDLNRPEGIVFGPDGNLYVCSFRANASDTDKIEEFNGTTGAYIGKIDLDQVGQPREFAQALLFGPDGKLFVPITGSGPDTGEVRRYDVSTGSFDVFVPPSSAGGPIGQGWYLTFRDTDPATLAFSPGPRAGGSTSDASSASRTALTAGLGTFLAPPTQSPAQSIAATGTAAPANLGPATAPLQFVAATGTSSSAIAPDVPTHSGTPAASWVDRVFADLGSEL